MSFYIGADVSSLQAMEDNGANYFDFNGQKDDALTILSKHGVNSIRLRIFNNPTLSFDRGDYCNVKNTIPMAKRVKEKGMSLYLDFHYSDFWADWQKQTIPEEWKNKSETEILDALYQYTLDTMIEFKNNNAWPDIVQIGNEIGKGFLWNYGTIENPGMMTRLLNAGIQAVNDASDDINNVPKIMIHIECGADIERTEDFFSLLESNSIMDFDYIGLSYYPYWSGKYEKFIANARNAYKKFNKKIIIAETAFPYTDDSNDDTPNVVSGELILKTMKLEPNPQNQYNALKKIIDIAKKEKCVEGVYYWEPVWYQIEGVGAEKGKGNEWENQALFDNKGHALYGIKAFAI